MPSVSKDNPTREDEVGLVLAGRLHPHGELRGVGGDALLRGRLVSSTHGGGDVLVVAVVPLVVVVVNDNLADYD